MAVSHTDFLDAANNELDEGRKTNSEAKLRSACRNFYYAVFHASEQLDVLLSNHADIPPNGMHQQRISKFKNYPTKIRPDHNVTEALAFKIRAFGLLMNVIHGDRIKADYKTTIDIKLSDVEQTCSNTKKAMEKLDELYKTLLT